MNFLNKKKWIERKGKQENCAVIKNRLIGLLSSTLSNYLLHSISVVVAGKKIKHTEIVLDEFIVKGWKFITLAAFCTLLTDFLLFLNKKQLSYSQSLTAFRSSSPSIYPRGN
jgi:hypothetical protein